MRSLDHLLKTRCPSLTIIVLDALVDLPGTAPTTLKKLVLTDSDALVHGVTSKIHTVARAGEFRKVEDQYKSLCVLGRRLEQLHINYIFNVNHFLDSALTSMLSSPWTHMQWLFVRGYGHNSQSGLGSNREACLDLTRIVVAHMPRA